MGESIYIDWDRLRHSLQRRYIPSRKPISEYHTLESEYLKPIETILTDSLWFPFMSDDQLKNSAPHICAAEEHNTIRYLFSSESWFTHLCRLRMTWNC